jgi:hypothetical protein
VRTTDFLERNDFAVDVDIFRICFSTLDGGEGFIFVATVDLDMPECTTDGL